MKGNSKSLEARLAEKKRTLERLKDEKRDCIAKRFIEPGLGEEYSIQDILDSTSTADEMLIFKDRYGIVWEIARGQESGAVYTEEDENILIDASVNLFM